MEKNNDKRSNKRNKGRKRRNRRKNKRTNRQATGFTFKQLLTDGDLKKLEGVKKRGKTGR